jgi:hypothetical protein
VAALGQPAFASSIMATPDMSCPEVQKPHLEAVMFDERGLDRVELAVVLQALDGG